MKKIFTILFMLTSILVGFSQGLVLMNTNKNVITETTVHVSILPNQLVSYEALVANTSSTLNTYCVRSFVYVKDASDSTQFCWGGTCYNFGWSVSTHCDTISRGDTVDFASNPNNGGFHSNFQAGPASIVRKVHYLVYNSNTATFPADTAGFTIQYNPTSAGIDEQKLSGTISNAFPNPSSSLISIDYNINSFSQQKAKISFYDMLGKDVKDMILNDKQGTAKINIEDLHAGVYFYSLMLDNKIVSTKKLIVYSK